MLPRVNNNNNNNHIYIALWVVTSEALAAGHGKLVVCKCVSPLLWAGQLTVENCPPSRIDVRFAIEPKI